MSKLLTFGLNFAVLYFMERLVKEATYNSPSIDFNPETGILTIEGRSIPEHANMFYSELIEWTKKYSAINPDNTEVNVKVDYLNSSSHKFLLEVFEKLESIHLSGKKIVINWYHEEDDEEMRETGNEYKEAVKIPFKLIQVDEF